MPLEFQWPFPSTNKVPKKWVIMSKIVIACVGGMSKFWIEWMNKLTIYNKSTIQKLVDGRPPNQPLITVCNHQCCIDDPFLWCTLRWRHLVSHNECMRWVSGATDICFTKSFHSTFFAYGRTVPTCRGDGVYQKGIDFLLEKLNNGEWVHVFPEGKVNMTHEFLRLKWGVGRLIAECRHLPVVLPMWHLGMDSVLPNTKPYIPLVGKKVTVVIGEPIDFREQLEALRRANKSPMEMRKQITDRIQSEFELLKKQAEEIHFGAAPVVRPEITTYPGTKDNTQEATTAEDSLHRQPEDTVTQDIKNTITQDIKDSVKSKH